MFFGGQWQYRGPPHTADTPEPPLTSRPLHSTDPSVRTARPGISEWARTRQVLRARWTPQRRTVEGGRGPRGSAQSPHSRSPSEPAPGRLGPRPLRGWQSVLGSGPPSGPRGSPAFQLVRFPPCASGGPADVWLRQGHGERPWLPDGWVSGLPEAAPHRPPPDGRPLPASCRPPGLLGSWAVKGAFPLSWSRFPAEPRGWTLRNVLAVLPAPPLRGVRSAPFLASGRLGAGSWLSLRTPSPCQSLHPAPHLSFLVRVLCLWSFCRKRQAVLKQFVHL